MPRKKQTKDSETLTASPDLALPTSPEGQALLEALRSNLSLLGELAVRYEVSTQPERPADLAVIHCPKDVHNLLRAEMSVLAHEQLRVLLLDTKNNVVAQRVIYQGNVNSSVIRPAEVLRPAVVESAPSIIISHNHPSGDPTPSPEDVNITRGWWRRPSCWASTCWTTWSSPGTDSSASTSAASCPSSPRTPDRLEGRPLRGGFPRALHDTHNIRRRLMLATERPQPGRPLHRQRGGVQRHRRRLRP